MFRSKAKKLIATALLACLVLLTSCYSVKEKTTSLELPNNYIKKAETSIDITVPSQTTTTTATSQSQEATITSTTTSEQTVQTTTPVAQIPVNLQVVKYYSLTADMQATYTKLAEGIKRNSAVIYFDNNISSTDFVNIYYLVKNTLYYSTNMPMSYKYSYDQASGRVLSVDMSYPVSLNESVAMTNELIARVNIIKSQMNPNATDFEKILFIHDTIINNCRYSVGVNPQSNPHVYTAYGALIKGSAVCEGYSKAFSLLCNEVGIDTLIVTGEAGGESHMWNMVKCNGQWYHMDVTWDDPVGATDVLSYEYFNVTTSKIQADHSIDSEPYIQYPVATSIKDNYYVKTGIFANSYEEAITIVVNEAVKAVQQNKDSIKIKLVNEAVYNKTLDMLTSPEEGKLQIYSLLNDAAEQAGVESLQCQKILINDKEYIMEFILQYAE